MSRHFEGHYPEIALVDGDYRVEWVDLDEGIDGFYDSDDPDDVHLLRFDFMYKDQCVDDGSYCTLMPVDTPEHILKQGLELIMDEVKDKCHGEDCPKRRLEELSWMKPESFIDKNKEMR